MPDNEFSELGAEFGIAVCENNVPLARAIYDKLQEMDTRENVELGVKGARATKDISPLEAAIQFTKPRRPSLR